MKEELKLIKDYLKEAWANGDIGFISIIITVAIIIAGGSLLFYLIGRLG